MNEPTIEEIKRQFSDALTVIVQLTKERDDEKKWSEELAKAVCEMEDVLGFKQDQTDEQGAMIPTFGPWKERVRDLLAKEGELGDMKEERDQLAAQLKELQSHVRCIYCNEKYTAEQSGELADHILNCEKSPLVQMVKQMESRITDYMDLMNDEFMRIVALTDNTEIIGICQRAQQVIAQKEPVIKQRDDALDKLRLSESQVVQLLDDNNNLKLDYSHSEAENAKLAAKCAEMRDALRSMVTQLEQEEIRTNFPFTSKLIAEIGRKALEACK